MTDLSRFRLGSLDTNVVYGAPLPSVPVQPVQKPVSFNVVRAGVIEIVVANGTVLELRPRINAVYDTGRIDPKTGLPICHVDMTLTDFVRPALTVDPPAFDAPNPYMIAKPVKTGN